MPDKGVESGILGNDVENGIRKFCGKTPNIIGNVEIESIAASSLNANVFDFWTKRLEFCDKVGRYFGLRCSDEDFNCEWVPTY